MNTDKSLELIRAAVTGALLDQWPFYLALVLLAIVGAALGGFLAAYFKSRGEISARTVESERLLNEVKRSTLAVESIRSAFQLADWKAKEANTIRRQKLEEFVSAVMDCHHWIRNYSFDTPVQLNPNPSFHVRLLGLLYFPEIDLRAFDKAFIDLRASIHETQNRLNAARNAGPDAHQAAWNEAINADRKIYQPFSNATEDIERQAAALMKNLIAGA
jgi:hypothetical protein